MNISNGKDLAALIVKTFALPEYTERVVIELSGKEPCVRMTVNALLTDENTKALGFLLKNSAIVPISEQFEPYVSRFEPAWDLVKFCQTGNGYQ